MAEKGRSHPRPSMPPTSQRPGKGGGGSAYQPLQPRNPGGGGGSRCLVNSGITSLARVAQRCSCRPALRPSGHPFRTLLQKLSPRPAAPLTFPGAGLGWPQDLGFREVSVPQSGHCLLEGHFWKGTRRTELPSRRAQLGEAGPRALVSGLCALLSSPTSFSDLMVGAWRCGRGVSR